MGSYPTDYWNQYLSQGEWYWSANCNNNDLHGYPWSGFSDVQNSANQLFPNNNANNYGYQNVFEIGKDYSILKWDRTMVSLQANGNPNNYFGPCNMSNVHQSRISCPNRVPTNMNVHQSDFSTGNPPVSFPNDRGTSFPLFTDYSHSQGRTLYLTFMA